MREAGVKEWVIWKLLKCLYDFSFSSADAKAILKNHILLTQKMGNSCEWNKYRDKLVLF